jgi:hypothetical protein
MAILACPNEHPAWGLQRVDQTWSLTIISKSRVGLVVRSHLRKLGRCTWRLRETKSSLRATTISDQPSRGRGTRKCGGPTNERTYRSASPSQEVATELRIECFTDHSFVGIRCCSKRPLLGGVQLPDQVRRPVRALESL